MWISHSLIKVSDVATYKKQGWCLNERESDITVLLQFGISKIKLENSLFHKLRKLYFNLLLIYV